MADLCLVLRKVSYWSGCAKKMLEGRDTETERREKSLWSVCGYQEGEVGMDLW